MIQRLNFKKKQHLVLSKLGIKSLKITENDVLLFE